MYNAIIIRPVQEAYPVDDADDSSILVLTSNLGHTKSVGKIDLELSNVRERG